MSRSHIRLALIIAATLGIAAMIGPHGLIFVAGLIVGVYFARWS